MARTFTNDFERDLLRPNAGGAWLWLCEIVVPNEPTERYTDDVADVTYNGDEFLKMAMQVGQQEFNSEGKIPRIMLRVSNVKATLERLMDASGGFVDGTVKLIRVNDKYLDSQISALEADYDVLGAQSDEEWTTFMLGIPNLLNKRYPPDEYSSVMGPEQTPSRFKGPRCKYAGADTTCTGTLSDCRDKGNEANWCGEIGLDPATTEVR